VNTLMADGHVQFVKDTVNVLVRHGLGSRNGGEVISGDAYGEPSCRAGDAHHSRPRPVGNAHPTTAPAGPLAAADRSSHNIPDRRTNE
jgi:hypothetical protein